MLAWYRADLHNSVISAGRAEELSLHGWECNRIPVRRPDGKLESSRRLYAMLLHGRNNLTVFRTAYGISRPMRTAELAPPLAGLRDRFRPRPRMLTAAGSAQPAGVFHLVLAGDRKDLLPRNWRQSLWTGEKLAVYKTPLFPLLVLVGAAEADYLKKVSGNHRWETRVRDRSTSESSESSREATVVSGGQPRKSTPIPSSAGVEVVHNLLVLDQEFNWEEANHYIETGCLHPVVAAAAAGCIGLRQGKGDGETSRDEDCGLEEPLFLNVSGKLTEKGLQLPHLLPMSTLKAVLEASARAAIMGQDEYRENEIQKLLPILRPEAVLGL
jgi:hypothetical protein